MTRCLSRGGNKALESGNKTYDHALEAEIKKTSEDHWETVIEIEVLKNGQTVSEKINAVKELKEKRGSIKESCELLGISRSSYYG